MASKRNLEDLTAYIHSVSPKKHRTRSFNVRLQTDSKNTRKAICFDGSKYDKLLTARLSGQAVKIDKIVNQSKDSTVSHFADYVINSATKITTLDPVNVTFPRKDDDVDYISLESENQLTVGTLVSVKGKLDLSHGTEKDVKIGMRNTKVLNQGYIFNESGSISLTVWGEWISFLRNKIEEGHTYFDFKNLLVRANLEETGLSTCSDTDCVVLSGDVSPGIDLVVADDKSSEQVLTEIDVIHELTFGYRCCKCRSIIITQPEMPKVVQCDHCGITVRLSKLSLVFEAVIECESLGKDLYKIDIGDLTELGNLSIDMDRNLLKEKLMSIQNIHVVVNHKYNQLKVVF